MALQEKIIAELGVKPSIDPKEGIRVSADFLEDYLEKHPFLKDYVLGISDGQDSSLVGRLVRIAVEELRAETGDDGYKFIIVRLPYGVQVDEEDAQRAPKFIQPNVSLAVSIKEGVDGQVRELEKAGIDVPNLNKGNIKAHQCMIIQYAVARAGNRVVTGTDHIAENITGFLTKFDDGGADIIPLYRLSEHQGKQLLTELGADPAIYEKIPTADLEENRPGIADEAALGVTYSDIDDYLEGKTASSEAKERIENWWRKAGHKRHLPVTVFNDFRK